MTRPYPFPAEAGTEPPLSELLNDPIMRRLLARDGLDVADVAAAIAAWRLARVVVPEPAAA